MGGTTTVSCTIEGLLARYGAQVVAFDSGTDLSLRMSGAVGPRGIGPVGADLLDLASSVYQIERQLRGRQRTNPPRVFGLRMLLRRPGAWNAAAREALIDALRVLGNAEWQLELAGGLETPIVEHDRSSQKPVQTICLFSGGMDSTCGASSLVAQAGSTQLVSFYTRQRTLQSTLAEALGFGAPIQFGQRWSGPRGRGRSFYYRSFLFLSLGAVIAESWGAREVLQFENGILASAIPPSPRWRMTHHAHPGVHRALERLYQELFGGEWQIRNPFSTSTKREGVRAALGRARGKRREEIIGLLARTETCWAHAQSRTYGAKKRAGQPCGVCMPCVVRRTAVPDEPGYRFDLRDDRVKNHETRGQAFRSWYTFLRRVQRQGRTPASFYSLLPGGGRLLVRSEAATLDGLHRLFRTFGREFRDTFQVEM